MNMPTDAPLDDPVVGALYSPGKRKIACVLLQAAFGVEDRRACRVFHDWEVNFQDDFIMISAPLSQWEHIGSLPIERRPGPEHFPPEARIV